MIRVSGLAFVFGIFAGFNFLLASPARAAAPLAVAPVSPMPAAQIDLKLVEQFDQIPDRAVPASGTYEYERFHFHWRPVMIQDSQTGRLLIDLSVIKNHIIPELKKKKIEVDTLGIAADGGVELGGRDLNIGLDALNRKHPYFLYDGGPVHQMHYARIVLSAHSKPVHVTDNGYIEKFEFPRLDPGNYSDFKEAEMKLPVDFRGDSKIDTSLVKLAGELQHANVVWAIAEKSKNEKLREAYTKFGFKLQPEHFKGNEQAEAGAVPGWEIVLPNATQGAIPGATPNSTPNSTSGATAAVSAQSKLRIAREDILTKGGAAFNQHSYFWDDHYVAEARAATDPKIALDTVSYWLNSQQADGGIGRELDYKGKPFQASKFIKYGVVEPNRDYFNPLIMGWAWHEIYNWNPQGAAPILPQVIRTMAKQREWMRNNHAVFDDDKKLIGFMWSNEGSGRDNAPRPLDETGMVALPLYGEKHAVQKGRDRRGLAVDLLAQYKTLIDHEIEFSKILGDFSNLEKLKAESNEIKETLNSRYFNNELGWYVDLVPTGNKAWEQTKDVTFAGFWPVAAKVADTERVQVMVRKFLENEKQFKSEFLPSVPLSNPYYDEGGHYWKGGGWPPDWEMAARALKELGIRAEAATLTERNLHAMTVASDGYKAGDTPSFLVKWVDAKPAQGSEASYNITHAKIDEYFRKFWSGEFKNPEPTDPKGNIFEFYGVRRSPQTGAPVATYGQTVITDDSTVHLTRSGFAGWGAVVPLRSAHTIFGLDAVPKFSGADAEFDQWLYSLFVDPELNYHFVKALPELKKIAKLFEEKTQPTLAVFKTTLAKERRASAPLRAQLKFLSGGYVELSPSFDPTTEGAELRNFNWQGIPFLLSLVRKSPSRFILTVESSKPIRIQFNKNWAGEKKESFASDSTSISTPILELGGQKRKWISISTPPED